MCKKEGCFYEGCKGCCWICKCQYRCFKCRTNEIGPTDCHGTHPTSYKPPRDKFVCFSCMNVWKSKYTKYVFETYNHKTGNHLISGNLINIEQRYPSYTDKDAISHCSRCGKEGILVGRNFRPCKNVKEWKKLENRFKAGEIDMIEDFTYYPREENSKVYYWINPVRYGDNPPEVESYTDNTLLEFLDRTQKEKGEE